MCERETARAWGSDPRHVTKTTKAPARGAAARACATACVHPAAITRVHRYLPIANKG
jgi:hypothetical protein